MTGIDRTAPDAPPGDRLRTDMRSAAEAVAYAKALHSLCAGSASADGNMQEGSFRCDANVSVRRRGGPLGTRCEIKNLNSFRFMGKGDRVRKVRRQVEPHRDAARCSRRPPLRSRQGRDEINALEGRRAGPIVLSGSRPVPLAISQQWIEENTQIDRRIAPNNSGESIARNTRSPPTTRDFSRESRKQSFSIKPFSAHSCRWGVALASLVTHWINGEVAALVNERNSDFSNVPVTAGQLARLRSSSSTRERFRPRRRKESFMRLANGVRRRRLDRCQARL